MKKEQNGSLVESAASWFGDELSEKSLSIPKKIKLDDFALEIPVPVKLTSDKFSGYKVIYQGKMPNVNVNDIDTAAIKKGWKPIIIEPISSKRFSITFDRI